MKKLVVAIALLAMGAVAFAAEEDDGINRANLPPGLVPKKFSHAQREARRQRVLKATGGKVRNLSTMKGVVKFLNAQKVVSASELQETVTRIGLKTQCDVQLAASGKDITPANAAAERATSGANAVVFLVESDALPAFLVAPEEKWAMVNARALTKDNAKAEDVATRLSREMWRGLGYMSGAFSMNDNCLMRPVYSLNDLDNLGVNELSYEPLYRMQMGLRSVGVHPYMVATYKKACEEGWAAAPTNDYQKAIWEEAHSEKEKGPSNALKIVPPKK